MNVEQNRLATFGDWPCTVMTDPARIARAGFFSTKRGLIVECFACSFRISASVWLYANEAHMSTKPNCPFIINADHAGNVPIGTTAPDGSSNSSAMPVASYLLLLRNDESVRLRTFENWPVGDIVTPESLAKAGFYFLGSRDKTKCPFCEGVVCAWQVGDIPDQEHLRHFPSCRFVQNQIKPRLSQTLSFPNVNIVTGDSLQNLGVNEHKSPKHANYATIEARLRTYTAWPEDLIQTPDTLAEAGFYYEGNADLVRCFHCDGGLRNWDPHDDPWTEHARWFSSCAFVRVVKGQDFVAACSLEDQVPDTEAQQANHKGTQPIQRREVTESEIQAEMMSPQAINVLNVGLSVGRIRQAIKAKLERSGRGFSSEDALIEATLNVQHEEEEGDEDSNSSMAREVTRLLTNMAEQILTADRTEERVADKKEEVAQKPTNTDVKAEGGEVEKTSRVLEEENRQLKEATLCKICMDKEVGIVFLPCGHLATCVNCAPNLQYCPVCRSAIKATVRTFLS